MIVSDLIKELAKIPNQNLPVWTEGGYIHIGELLHIRIGKSEEEKAMSELKPCPFCGGRARLQVRDDEGNWHDEDYIMNPWSGLSYGIVHDETMTNGDCIIATHEEDCACHGIWLYDTPEEAIAAWNRRAE